MSNNEMKVYAVTGVEHGSIVSAVSEKEARETFQRVYNNEEILDIIDITNHNLENL